MKAHYIAIQAAILKEFAARENIALPELSNAELVRWFQETAKQIIKPTENNHGKDNV